VEQGAFTTLDAALEWHPAQRGPSLRLWAQNLTGSEYYDSLVTFPTTGVLQRPAAPRRLGFSIGYSY
jgi:outer membrane receptor protein involved in Fe transport